LIKKPQRFHEIGDSPVIIAGMLCGIGLPQALVQSMAEEY
jgi:hypothetical protein